MTRFSLCSFLLSASAMGQACCVGQREDWETRLDGLMDGCLTTSLCQGGSVTTTAATRSLLSVTRRPFASSECGGIDCATDGETSSADNYSGLSVGLWTSPTLTNSVTFNFEGGTFPSSSCEPFFLSEGNVTNQITASHRYVDSSSGWEIVRWHAAGQFQIDSRRTLNSGDWVNLDPHGKMVFSLSAIRDTTPDFDCEGSPSLPTTPVTILVSGTYRFSIQWTDGGGAHSDVVAAFVSIRSDGSMVLLGEAANSSLFAVDSTLGDGTLSATLDIAVAPWFRIGLPTCGANVVFDTRTAQGYQPDGNLDGSEYICFTDYVLLAQLASIGPVSYVDAEYILAGDLDADGDIDGDDLEILGERCAVADFLCDGFVDFFDYDAYVVAFELGSLEADTDGNGFIDFFDYDGYIALFENSECGC